MRLITDYISELVDIAIETLQRRKTEKRLKKNEQHINDHGTKFHFISVYIINKQVETEISKNAILQ